MNGNEPNVPRDDAIVDLPYAPRLRRRRLRPRSWAWIVLLLGALASLALAFFYVTAPCDELHIPATNALARVAVSWRGTLRMALEKYRTAMGRYPTTVEGLNALFEAPDDGRSGEKWTQGGGPFVNGAQDTTDPWGNDYIYVCPGVHNTDAFDLSSAGPDGQAGTEDDITNWGR